MESKTVFHGDMPAGFKCVDCPRQEECPESPINLFYRQGVTRSVESNDWPCSFAVEIARTCWFELTARVSSALGEKAARRCSGLVATCPVIVSWMVWTCGPARRREQPMSPEVSSLVRVR